MATLKNTEILTRQVYLNIESKERGEVETIGMPTTEAIEQYGDLEVIETGQPLYADESTAANAPRTGRGKKAEADSDPRKEGTTAVRLRAAE